MMMGISHIEENKSMFSACDPFFAFQCILLYFGNPLPSLDEYVH